MDDDPKPRGTDGEPPTGEDGQEGGGSYTNRPSKERPEDGGATRDEDRERPDGSEGREKA